MRLTAESFATLMAPFAPFETRPVLAVAVSGGRDSLALALLAGEWSMARGGHVVGLIVDHGLRTGATAEAVATRDLLARHDIDADILHWTGAKPTHGLQEAARAARYELLFGACRERGKSGKSQDFTLSECRLMLRQVPASRRLRWIVRHENGRRNDKKGGQPLIPAAFFACGGLYPPHVD